MPLVFDAADISELSERIAELFVDSSEAIVSKLYANSKLSEFLELIDAEKIANEITSRSKAIIQKILVIGQTSGGSEKAFRKTAENVGVSGDRLELYLDYFDAKKINFEKFRNNPEYCAILLGPLPHSGKSKGNYSSIAAMLEHEPGFPRTILLGRNGLKLTANSLQIGLAQLAAEGVIF